VQLEKDRDIGKECAIRPRAYGDKFSPEVFDIGDRGVFEGEECDKGISQT